MKPEFWVIFCGADLESCFRALGGFIGVGIAFFGYSAFIYVYVCMCGVDNGLKYQVSDVKYGDKIIKYTYVIWITILSGARSDWS